MNVEYRTYRGYQEDIAETARQEFCHHVLVPEGTGRWLCRRPGTGIFSFRVVASPGTVIIHGDIGDNIAVCYDRDPIPWLRGAAKSEYPDYFLSKLRFRREVFFMGDALEYLAELDQDYREDEAEWEPCPGCDGGALTIDATGEVGERCFTCGGEDVVPPDPDASSPLADRIRGAWMRDSGPEPFMWLGACYDAGDDDPPTCTAPGPGMLYTWHAARTFMRLLDAERVAVAGDAGSTDAP